MLGEHECAMRPGAVSAVQYFGVRAFGDAYSGGREMTPPEFAAAIGEIESGDNPDSWGDQGRAMGRYQLHPDWLWEWASRLGTAPHLNERWDDWATRIVEAFFVRWTAVMLPVEVAMFFHEGHVIKAGAAGWDSKYADRFTLAS